MAEQANDTFVEKAFRELAECSICCDVFDEPKMLPCFHSFCLKCLSDYGKNKNPGDMLSCPICRLEFAVPNGGYSTLRGNFFVNRIKELYQATQSSAGQTVLLCEACGFGNDGETKSKDVENFCVDCCQKMCSKCCTMHRQFAILRTHQIVPLKPGNDSLMKDLLKERMSPCEVHPSEKVQLYCVNCKSAICLLCYALKHNSHQCDSIETVAENERRCINQDLEAISKRIEEIKKQESSVELLKSDLFRSIGAAESTIQNTATEMINVIVNHRDIAIGDLNLKKQLKEKELSAKTDELQTIRIQMESFCQFTKMLMDNGNHAEVARLSDDTRQKAKNLQEILVSKNPAKQEVEVSFRKSEILTKLKNESKNLVGDLLIGMPVTETVKKSPSVTNQATRSQQGRTVTKVFLNKIQGTGCILGISVLGSQIFVSRLKSSNIDIFCLNSYKKLRTFAVQGLQDPSDMASCSVNNCLYINGQEERCIFKIGSDGKLLDSWKVQEKPFRLSVDSSGQVTVTFREALCLRVYGMDGSSLMSLKLPDDMKSPRNAFYIDSNKFVVCHGELGEPLHRVCELDALGHIIRWYGGAEGSGPTLINVPVHMIRVPNAINKYLVADLNNHRVHLIEDFQLVTHILTAKDGVKSVRKLEMHDDRLFVAQDDGCIQVFDVNLDYPTRTGGQVTETAKKSRPLTNQATKSQQARTATKAFLTKIEGTGCILGISVLGSQIFVSRLKSSNVDIFCLNSYKKLRTFAVQGLQDPSDMASCSVSNCLYINGQEDRCIFKVGSDGKLLDCWKVQEKPFRLSVDSSGQVTVTFREALCLRVYGMDGSSLMSLKLPDDMKSPRNAFYIDSNKFVVCHGELGEPLHRVCELDALGHIIRWYGGAEGSDPTLINVPVHMIRVPNAINKYLVADLNNHRVHLIEDFQLITHILTAKDGVKLVRKLEMHEDRLFVAQDDGCIQVFDVNLDYPTCKTS